MVNPFLSSGHFYLNSLFQSISKRGFSVLLLPCFIKIPIFNANNVNPDQTPQNAASDQGLHCLPMSCFWDARHKLVEV